MNFPQIAVPDDFADNGGNSKILWGFNEGTLIEDITAREKSTLDYFEPEYPCQGIMGVYPAVVNALSAFCFWKIDLEKQGIENIQRELREKGMR